MTNCLKLHIAHGATEGCAHRPRMVSVSFSRWKMMCQQWHCWGNFDFIVSAKACSTYAPFHPCHFTGLNDSHNFLTMKLFCNSYIVLMHLIILINMLLFSCNIRFLFIALILFSGCCSEGCCAPCFPFLDRTLTFENTRVALQWTFVSLDNISITWAQNSMCDRNETEARTESLMVYQKI